VTFRFRLRIGGAGGAGGSAGPLENQATAPPMITATSTHGQGPFGIFTSPSES
jgi:hypothetical protein